MVSGPAKWIRTFVDILVGRGPGAALLETAKHFWPEAQHWAGLLEHEWSYRHSGVPIIDRLRLLRRGYVSGTHHIYRFSGGVDTFRYLSTLDQIASTGDLNGEAARYLNDKRSFHRLLAERGHRDVIPDMFAVVVDGEWRGVTDPRELADVLAREKGLVIKDATGSGGSDVVVCKSDGDLIRVNGEPCDARTFRARLGRLDNHIVTEFCEQTAYANRMFPESANTIRALTIHPVDASPSLPAAAHRIGTETSKPVDSFSRGGVAATIDVDSGELGRAWRKRTDLGAGGPFHRHPDTDAQIEGAVVPGWKRIRERLLAICHDLAELRYVGWDILVTAPGEFRILEGNNQPGEIPLQLEEPLLANDQVRAFYRKHGVV